MRSFFAAALAAALLWPGYGPPAAAQRIYAYRDEAGNRVFSDRQPLAGSPFEERQITRVREQPEVQLLQRETDAGGVLLVARNTFYAPVQIAYRVVSMDNVAADTPTEGLTVVAARSDAALVDIRRERLDTGMHFEYEFRYLPGSPVAEHRPFRPYRLPYASARRFAVSQAFPEQITHKDLASQYAIDFVMPIGTPIYAARAGIVIQVASDFFESGLDPGVDGPRANVVRVLHDDGTMALYAHLNWNSIRVVPGQQVERGEYLADSGNTGFSSGPHLHFVVQKNRDGALVSVPIEFAGPAGRAIEVHVGDRPAAY